MDPRFNAQGDIQCDMCNIAMVQMHCDTCLVSLCKDCVGDHAFADLSKPHKIVNFKKRKSTPIYSDCVTHVNEQCKTYCKQCNIPLCMKCLASGQHLGHTLLEVLQVLDEKRDGIMKERTELNDIIYPTYKNIASDLENRMTQLEKEFGDLSMAVTKHGKYLHGEIDNLEKKLKSEVDEMKKTQINTLQKYLNEIKQILSEIWNEINSLDAALDSEDISKLCTLKPNVDEYRQLPQTFVSSLPEFIPGRAEGDEFSQLFGVLTSSLCSEEDGNSMNFTQKSSTAGSSAPIKQLLVEPEAVTSIMIKNPCDDFNSFYGQNSCYTQHFNIACLSDEKIWAGENDNVIKLFSTSQGLLLNSTGTKSGHMPGDISVTKNGDLVYNDYNYRTVNILKNEKIEEVIRLQNWRPRGVYSNSSGDLLVIIDSYVYKHTKVIRYSGSTEKQSIQFDDKGKPLYSFGSSTKYITENRNLDICVSDNGAKAVVVVNQAGKLKFGYTGHIPTPKNKPFSPKGITTDSQYNILIADIKNSCVHIIDLNGQFLCFIDCGLMKPYGLCVDSNDNMFVAQCLNGQVMKIKYLQ
ncbi:uncharacterized protein LOC133178129 [Saccostrea echinata]|uniref:uncharacterized protein LOC133178129 n=1 Tax=Saccostrea echinata TaxID=191078 RepID=UPI002A80E1EA|nr:uncharacterized protein LOC133178129 [Saccostrea echinata]